MQKFIKKNGTTILSVLACAGVIATTVLSLRASPKAAKLLKEREKEELDTWKKVKILVPVYTPVIISGTVTIICILGANVLSRHQQASLMSAYAMLNESYKHYRKAAKTVYGEDADDKIHAEMAKDAMVASIDWGYQVYDMNMDSGSERLLFYDLASNKYFRTTMSAVLNAQYHANRNVAIKGDCSLNEYLSFLGVEGIDNGDKIGWDISYMVEEMECYWLDFDNHKITLEDGRECIVVDAMPPNIFD